jgi:hypothetical protein
MREFIEEYRPSFDKYLEAEHSVGYWPGSKSQPLNALDDMPPADIATIHGTMRMRDVFMRILEEMGEAMEHNVNTPEHFGEMADVLIYMANACIWAGHEPGEQTELWRAGFVEPGTSCHVNAIHFSEVMFYRTVVNCSRLCPWMPHRVARKSDQLRFDSYLFGCAMDTMIRVFLLMVGRMGYEGEPLRQVARRKIAANNSRLADA